MGPSRTVLVCGPGKAGKTALIKRAVNGRLPDHLAPTIGLDEEAGELCYLATDELIDDLLKVLPEDGLRLSIMEIGGSHGGHLRPPPRGRQIDGVVLCYNVLDRSSFHTAVTVLMRLRTDRHVLLGPPEPKGSFTAPLPRLPVILCGTHIDLVDQNHVRAVTESEAQAFARDHNIAHALTVSATTGEFAAEAFQALAVAILQAEEEAVLEAVETNNINEALASAWSLKDTKGYDAVIRMTSPRGERRGEPAPGPVRGPKLLEFIDLNGQPLGARPLETCLERGLLHRAVHVWLSDPASGGILLRKANGLRPKFPNCWVPSCHGEVLCHGSSGDAAQGPHAPELAQQAAQRILQEQLGVEKPCEELSLWFSCLSRKDRIQELIDVFVVPLGTLSLSNLKLEKGEQVEWVHFLDVFGDHARHVDTLFHVEESYRSSFVQRMRCHVGSVL